MVNDFIVDLGVDDTDSENGMCTTYLAYLIIQRLIYNGDTIIEYPKLIRLNPNIPWKTRGNGAVSIRFKTSNPQKDFEDICEIVYRNADLENHANPGLVMSTLQYIPSEISDFSKKALSEVVSKRLAMKIMSKNGIIFKGWSRKRGLIGALASIGNSLSQDITFELLAFRKTENWRKKRLVDKESIIKMNKKMGRLIFNSYDFEKDRILITPRGPDPILLGLRGESPENVYEAYLLLRIQEEISGFMIFKTNQGTSEHLNPKIDLDNIKAYRSGHFKCIVQEDPITGQGGHVYIRVRNEKGEISCAAYEPTGQFRKKVLLLIPGDHIEVGGSVRKKTSKHNWIINLEYLKVINLAKDLILENPVCDRCNRKMSSLGTEKGFRCDYCDLKNHKIEKTIIDRPRKISVGLYLPPPRAQRHLTKPEHRYLNEGRDRIDFINNWIRF